MKRQKWNWRKHLTPAEAAFMRECDAEAKKIAEAQASWSAKYQLERIKIVNRALQRAIHAGNAA